MSKLTLLLIPLIFLSSCTIDWNDEKDKKIAELEKQIQELENDKELELQKFEFEKEKYEETKTKDKQTREDKFAKECSIEKGILLDQLSELLNKNCKTPECANSLASDPRFAVPEDYIQSCVESKSKGTWEGN